MDGLCSLQGCSDGDRRLCPLGVNVPPSPCGGMRGYEARADGCEGQGKAGSPHCSLPSMSCFLEGQERKLLLQVPGEVMLGSLGPSLQISSWLCQKWHHFVEQISSLGSFLISDMSGTETLPAPQALRKLGCSASLCSTLCLFIIHGIMFVLWQMNLIMIFTVEYTEKCTR